MGQNVNIGKNTIGDNGKMSVHLHGYERSNHNLGYKFRNTQAVGTLVPFCCELMLPEDDWDISLESKVLTHPTVGPLFGSFKLQNDMFFVPFRLYNGALHNNALNIGLNMSRIKLPQMRALLSTNSQTDDPTPENYRSQINPSSLLYYLGLSGMMNRVGTNIGAYAEKLAIPLLGYWDIVKNYYANKQEPEAYYIGSGGQIVNVVIEGTSVSPGAINKNVYDGDGVLVVIDNLQYDEVFVDYVTYSPNSTGGSKLYTHQNLAAIGNVVTQSATSLNVSIIWPDGVARMSIVAIYSEADVSIKSFPLENIDNMRTDLLKTGVDEQYMISDTTMAPYGEYMKKLTLGGLQTKTPMFGLALRTYNSDLFNNWINTDWIDGENGINAISSVDVSDGSLTMDALNLAKKVYDMLNRIAVSGGSYQDWVETVWDSKYSQRCETPRFEGGMSEEIGFQEVISNAASEEEPLGTLAGRGITLGKQKGGSMRVRADEPGFLMGISSIVPRVDYSQGSRFYNDLKTMDDLFKPALNQLGYQDALLKEFAWWTETVGDQGNVTNMSVGKQPAWIKYQTNYNRSCGEFAAGQSESFMVLNRDYEMDAETNGIADLTTYIKPSKFNRIFADTRLSSMNFWVQIGVDIRARRKMSAKSIPNL